MLNLKRLIISILSLIFPLLLVAGKPPALTPHDTKEMLSEILNMHAVYHEITPEIARRSLMNAIEELDPAKTYFLASDIETWLNPTPELLQKIAAEHRLGRYTEFEALYTKFVEAVARRNQIEKTVTPAALDQPISVKAFKEAEWSKEIPELAQRLALLQALQYKAAREFDGTAAELSLQRIQKRRLKREEQLTTPDAQTRQAEILTLVLRATTAALDMHTVYFTPDEAAQFMIGVEQRLFGLGVQLRDDLEGFSVVKIVEGGPAAREGHLREKDRIIAVDHEPVVGMDISEAVELIRGKNETAVVITVIREHPSEPPQKLDITILRGEVTIQENRLETAVEPFGQGVIGLLKLYSFYQDPRSSSASDLKHEIEQLKQKHNLLGLVLDLRYNGGGLLPQAVEVASLFMHKGVVVSVKDEQGHLHNLRDTEENMIWDGPLVILVNRASASASEIVAQTLQDYGRALVVGDDHTFGKGSFQTFSLDTHHKQINPKGEYKVTRGIYYTVSGKSPQRIGVQPDITIPGPLSLEEVGECYSKSSLDNSSIEPRFEDDLSDLPFFEKQRMKWTYKKNLQQRLTTYRPYVEILQDNSQKRLKENKDHQALLALQDLSVDKESIARMGQNDQQLTETVNVMKDLLFLLFNAQAA